MKTVAAEKQCENDDDFAAANENGPSDYHVAWHEYNTSFHCLWSLFVLFKLAKEMWQSVKLFCFMEF